MFLHLSVILFTGGGGGVHPQEDTSPGQTPGQTPPGQTPPTPRDGH